MHEGNTIKPWKAKTKIEIKDKHPRFTGCVTQADPWNRYIRHDTDKDDGHISVYSYDDVLSEKICKRNS